MHGDDSPQMMLFAELPVPSDAADHLARRSRMHTPWRLAVLVLRLVGKPRRRPKPDPEQLPLHLVLRDLDCDDIPEPPVVHRLVKAADARPVQTAGFSSVFSMADAAKASKALRLIGRFGAAAGFEPAPYRVEREAGRVRLVRLLPEETEEWQERERARRARQRPPRPTKKAQTRGKKLLDMIGEGSPDD